MVNLIITILLKFGIIILSLKYTSQTYYNLQ
jgi:hypothetical protein